MVEKSEFDRKRDEVLTFRKKIVEDQEWEKFVSEKKVETSSPEEDDHDGKLQDTYNRKRAV